MKRISSSPNAAVKAREKLDHVFVGTIEEFLACDAVKGMKFDYITFDDVLEHMVYSIRTLVCTAGKRYCLRRLADIDFFSRLEFQVITLGVLFMDLTHVPAVLHRAVMGDDCLTRHARC